MKSMIVIQVLVAFFATLPMNRVYSQSNTLVIQLKRCDMPDYCQKDSRQRHIGIIKEGVFLYENMKGDWGKYTIEGLEIGHYKIRYTNIFGQIVEHNLEVLDSLTRIDLCTDKFQDFSIKTLTSQLSIGDTLELFHISSGCFHGRRDTIQFYIKSGQVYGKSLGGEVGSLTVKLDSNTWNKLIVWEKQGLLVQEYSMGCTTREFYMLRLREKVVKFSDYNCDWEGFDRLKKLIFRLLIRC